MDTDQLASLLPILLIVLAFWFLVLRPARKRQQDAQRLQRSLDVGEQVMLTSGIYGRVRGMGDESLELEIATGVVVTVNRHAVARVVQPGASDHQGTPAADGEEPAVETDPADDTDPADERADSEDRPR